MKVVIFGTEDIASLARFYLENDSKFTPVAFCIDGKYIKENSVEGLPVIPFEEIEKSHTSNDFFFFAPLYDNKLRANKTKEIKEKGYSLITYVSSKATIWTKNIGENCFIMENNVIQPYVSIGNNVIFWSGNHIGHHGTIGNNIFFSSHVVLSGNCIVEDFTWFGVNCTIRDQLTIAKGCVIGMGSIVTKNTIENKTYIGNPAKCIE